MEPPERKKGFDQWWYVLPPDHCSFYKKETFEWVLEGSPHKIIAAEAKYIIIRKKEKSSPAGKASN